MKIAVKVIGAGVSGLAVGRYLQMNRFETEIFEMHDLPRRVVYGLEPQGLHLRRLNPLAHRLL